MVIENVMKKICMVIIACVTSVFLISCQQGIEEDTIKIEKYLETSVWELANYELFIEKHSSGEAHLLVETSFSMLKIGEKNFYPVYVGEQWNDHRVNWEWFYVSEQLDEILWYNLGDGGFYSLEEWRTSKEYRTVDGSVHQEQVVMD